MDVLYMLEKLRMPVLNSFMLAITTLGEETAFLVVALILFWCVDKQRGYYVLAVGFVGTLANQFLKLVFRIPRPWVLDENFTILEQAREAASGYSFPSGHTQSAVGTFGAIGYTAKNRWTKGLCIAVAALVSVSRMYIGVHTPADVLTSVGIALLLIVTLKPLVYKAQGKNIPALLGIMLLLSLGFLCYVELYPFPTDVDAHNLQSGVKNAYTLLGCLLGLILVYILDNRWLRFPVDAPWWAQIGKVLCGLLAVLAVKEGLRLPLDALFGGHMIARAVRYFFIVVMAGVIWPMSFTWFSKLGRKNV